MTTATDTAAEQSREGVARENHGKLLERHRLGASENDIRSAFRDFLVRTGIAADESGDCHRNPPHRRQPQQG